jgi:hypothetical protein
MSERCIGIETETGKAVLVSTQPGGILDRMADAAGLEAAELAAFLRPTVAALREVLDIAVKHASDEARRALRGTMRSEAVSACENHS